MRLCASPPPQHTLQKTSCSDSSLIISRKGAKSQSPFFGLKDSFIQVKPPSTHFPLRLCASARAIPHRIGSTGSAHFPFPISPFFCSPSRVSDPSPDPLYLCGPLASGKSALAISLCLELDGEVVNADPFQAYRGLETLTDVPGEETLAKRPTISTEFSTRQKSATHSRFTRWSPRSSPRSSPVENAPSSSAAAGFI